MLKTTILLFLGFCLPSTITLAQGPQAPDSIDMFVKSKMKQKHIPALQLAIVRGGKIVKNASYGNANLENNIPVSNQSLFSINSITKAFTGVAIMQLAEAGKLKVTDPVSLYLDSLPAAWQKITLQQLLTHTSGLPDMLNEEEMVLGKGDEQMAMREVVKLPLLSPVGERFSYNQTGYVLLGQLITKLSGMHFTKFIEERQFKVAGMQLTRFGDSYDVIPNSAGSYTMTKQIGEQFVRNQTPGVSYIQFPVFFRTAAGIISTATDMGNWILALKSGKLLKEQKSMETMWTPAVLNNGKIGGFNRLTNGYALGWPTVSRAEHPAVAPVGGGRSALFVYQKDDLSIVVLTNLMGANPDQFVDEIAGFYIPDMKEANGFGLPASLKSLRSELLKVGFDKAAIAVKNLKQKDAGYNVTEAELNGWGYQLLAQKKMKEALSIFKLNVSLNPKSANAYDSLAEMYETLGEENDALLNYRQSVSLNPENKNAEGRIKALSGN